MTLPLLRTIEWAGRPLDPRKPHRPAQAPTLWRSAPILADTATPRGPTLLRRQDESQSRTSHND